MTERSGSDAAILEAAIAWRAALEREDADWDGYVAWLEADPRHRRAFNALDLVEATVEDHRDAVQTLLADRALPGQVQAPAPATAATRAGRARPRAVYLGAAVAAAVALVLAVPALWAPESVRTYQADAGAPRQVALAGGIAVTLSPKARIVVHGEDAARIELSGGEAYFDVAHDPARTLSVEAGDYRISDIGTRFSVNLSGSAFRLGVAQGRVVVSSPAIDRGVAVAAGQQLQASGQGVSLAPVAASEVASWRSGRLSYSDAPLALVAADVARYSGRPVTIDPSLEKTHFSGSLVVGDGSRLASELAAIVGVPLRRGQDGDRLGAAAR